MNKFVIDYGIELNILQAVHSIQRNLSTILGKDENGKYHGFQVKVDIQIGGPKEKQKELEQFGAQLQEIMNKIPKEYKPT